MVGSCTDQGSGAKEEKAVAITVTSTAFEAGKPIPKRYTGEGENVSPPLAWPGAPAGTKELALICDDPDAPRPQPFVHWVLYGIPPTVTSLQEAATGAATDGLNGRGQPGYTGPMPPPGSGPHHYHFKIYALDAALGLKPGLTKTELLKSMEGHILAQGELIGTYERK
ncbi:MAG TPA: YbhB/YbcL family Raf kinase inhibitor-like protein [bacterium]|nr:YbhB/YbcL family Raf kinase inhibitor-like protein [bacterium]